MHAFGRLIDVGVARRKLLAATHPVERTDLVRVDEAFGRVAASTYRAPRPVPGFSRATWDGYALRAADTRAATRRHPTELRVVGEVFAEQAYPGRVGPGETVAIATGGALPPGTDAVVIFEDVERRGARIRVPHPVPVGDRFSPPGHDFPRGKVLVRRGEELTPPALGTLAACGIPKVRVFSRPVVAILPNGNELLAPGAREHPGMIYESNNASLSAVIVAAGGIPRPLPPLPDWGGSSSTGSPSGPESRPWRRWSTTSSWSGCRDIRPRVWSTCIGSCSPPFGSSRIAPGPDGRREPQCSAATPFDPRRASRPSCRSSSAMDGRTRPTAARP